jgi:AcrR family transcriptional regulator
MPRTEEQNKIIKDRRKMKIMEKALMLFATRGFDFVTVDDITKEVGCSHGLFYHYFTGKEDVYNQLITFKNDPAYAEFHLPIKEAEEAGGIKGIEVFVNYADKIASADDAVFYFVRLSLTKPLAQTAKGSLMGMDLYPIFLKLVEQGQAAGDIYPGDPRVICNMYMDFCNGAMDRRFAMGREKYEVIHKTEIMRIFRKAE